MPTAVCSTPPHASQPTEASAYYWPLQQYLIEFPGGRLQTLSIAWNARKLVVALPEDANVQQLVTELEGTK